MYKKVMAQPVLAICSDDTDPRPEYQLSRVTMMLLDSNQSKKMHP